MITEPTLLILIGIMILAGLVIWLATKEQRKLRSSTEPHQLSREITDKDSLVHFLKSIESTSNRWDRQNTVIKNVDLTGITMTGADFRYCRFDGTCFRNALLQDADFSEADFRNVDFRNADLSRCRFYDATIWDKTNFADANLSNASLQHVKFHSDELSGVNFDSSDIQNVSFAPNTDLTTANFHNAKYNFFTVWPQFDPEDAGAISIDGLGPNPIHAKRSKWDVYKSMRDNSLRRIRDKYSDTDTSKVPIRLEIRAKLQEAIEDSDLEKALQNWKNPSLSELYTWAAHDIRHVRFMLQQISSIRPDFELMLLNYFDAWLDVLEFNEYQNLTFHKDGTAWTTAITYTPPKFESPIEEMFWKEWQRRGGKSVIDLQYQYRDDTTRYRIDFVFLPLKVAIELDGYEYHSSKEQFTADRQRQRKLELQGWRFIRFSGSEIVKDVNACFSDTLRFIKSME